MATYRPLYRHMSDYVMKGYAPGIKWEYTKAAHDWPKSPHPRSKYMFGEFVTETPLSPEQVEQLEVERIDSPLAHEEALTAAEHKILRHWSMWGSDGYPIQKLSTGKWVWNEWFGIKGAPTVYKTKREVTEAIEAYVSLLIDRNGREKQAEALAAHNQTIQEPQSPKKDEQTAFSDAFRARYMPAGPIRKVSKGLDGLPLFDPKVAHETKQQTAQQKLL